MHELTIKKNLIQIRVCFQQEIIQQEIISGGKILMKNIQPLRNMIAKYEINKIMSRTISNVWILVFSAHEGLTCEDHKTK